MDTLFSFIAQEIAARLEHESKVALQLHCEELGIFFGEFYEDFPCTIKQYILGTTWTDFFEDVWEKHMHDRLIDPDSPCAIADCFVCMLAHYAAQHTDDLVPWITNALSDSAFCSYSCEVIDREAGKMRIMTRLYK